MTANHRHSTGILRIIELGFMGLLLGCTGHLFPLTDPSLQKVAFHYEGRAKSVCIVGDFNQWNPNAHCLKQRRGRWSIRLPLPHGPIHYAFIVNGEKWVMDPKALYVENDGFGRQNSVVMVE